MDALLVENVSKKYILYPNPRHLFREVLLPDCECPFEKKWAVKEINLSVPRGQVCGLIGRNGSGKSTLLGIMAEIISPTGGRITAKGRISTLLELGAGFQPELTGRENIFLKARIFGMPRSEVRKNLEDIVEFSGISTYIDKPIKTYSNGMLLRLGFSTAIHMDFDILLIDEVLAVGDLSFQRKCIAKLRQFKENGKTIILSGHSLADVAALCDRVLLLESGRVVLDGAVEEVIRHYMEECEKEQNKIHKRYDPFKKESVYGKDTGEIRITHVQFLNENAEETDLFQTQQSMTMKIGYCAKRKIKNPLFRVQIFRNDGLWVHGANTYRQGIDLGVLEGHGEVELRYDCLNLLEADYFVSVGIWPDEYKSMTTDVAYDLHELAYIIRVRSRRADGGGIVHNPFCWRIIRNGEESEPAN